MTFMTIYNNLVVEECRTESICSNKVDGDDAPFDQPNYDHEYSVRGNEDESNRSLDYELEYTSGCHNEEQT